MSTTAKIVMVLMMVLGTVQIAKAVGNAGKHAAAAHVSRIDNAINEAK